MELTETFEERKAALLSSLEQGVDRSIKGSIDLEARPLCAILNAHPDFVTTSSCSGRVSIFWDGGVVPKEQKKEGEWVYVDHDRADLSQMLSCIDGVVGKAGNTTLKYEPFLLHVETRNLDRARDLVAVALRCGFRESGIVCGRRYIVAIRCSIRLEIPVVHQGVKLVSDEYITFLAEEVERKFVRNRERIEVLYQAVVVSLGAGGGGFAAPSPRRV